MRLTTFKSRDGTRNRSREGRTGRTRTGRGGVQRIGPRSARRTRLGKYGRTGRRAYADGGARTYADRSWGRVTHGRGGVRRTVLARAADRTWRSTPKPGAPGVRGRGARGRTRTGRGGVRRTELTRAGQGAGRTGREVPTMGGTAEQAARGEPGTSRPEGRGRMPFASPRRRRTSERAGAERYHNLGRNRPRGWSASE
jgi:hypothetical protein